MVSRLKSITKSSNQYPIYNENITVDAKHSDMVRHFKQLQESLPELNKDLKRKVSEYNNKDPTRKNDLEYIIYRDQLKENIRDIKERIKSIQSNEEMNQKDRKIQGRMMKERIKTEEQGDLLFLLL